MSARITIPIGLGSKTFMVGFISNLTYIEKPCGNVGLFLLMYSNEYLSEHNLINRAAFCIILS